jgi:serine/threonine protein kinase
MKRRERMFEVVGCSSYLAPDFFTEDGYGQEVDIWAATVMLFYLLVHDYPFKFKGSD